MGDGLLTKKIKDFALHVAGFDLVGVAPARIPDKNRLAVQDWIQRGMMGSMRYLETGLERRLDPKKVLSSARSAVCVAMNYGHPEDPRPEGGPFGKVARYAYGSDYHPVMRRGLKILESFIRETAGGTAVELKSFVDTGPVFERALAASAGIGFIGKNTNLITERYGSWVFLGVMPTNLDLACDVPASADCGTCRRCVEACPAGALTGDYRMDARKCISYLTIESKKDLSADERARIGEWFFGCDACQEACPLNRDVAQTRHDAFYPGRIAGTWVDLKRAAEKRQAKEAGSLFRGSALERRKREGLASNAGIVLGNVNRVLA